MKKKEPTEKDKKKRKKKININKYLMKNFKEENKIEKVIRYENKRQLAWPIQKTSFVK